MGQWSDLLAELVIGIEERLILYVDKVRFRSVCMSWNSYPPKIKIPNNHQGTQFPWLLHPVTQDENNTTEAEAEAEAEASHGLFYPHEKIVYYLDLPDAQGMFFKGSSFGWVVTIPDTVTGTGPDMYLINPLTKVRIQLPPRSKFPDVVDYHSDQIGTEYEYTMKFPNHDDIYDTSSDHVNLYLLMKVVLSSAPFSEDCVVVAIYGECGRLAYCKCNDREWKFLFGVRTAFTDVIFHKGKLHALNCLGNLLVFENIGHNPKVTQIPATPPPKLPYSLSQYLVESCDGELIMALRHYRNHTFSVYKLDPTKSIWVHMNNIGDNMLFLGWNSSLAVSSRDFPGYKGNRIYFADDYATLEQKIKKEGVYIGVFNLENRCSESLPGYSYAPKLVWPPPVWMTPSTF